MKIRNLVNDMGTLVAIDERGDQHEVGPALRTCYLAAGGKPPKGWHAEPARGGYLRLSRKVKRELWQDELKMLRAHPDPILEADVPAADRALADLPELEVSPCHTWVAIDIETADSEGKFTREHAAIELVSFAWQGSDGRSGYAASAQVGHEQAERDLLEKAHRVLGAYDVALAWNGGKEWGDDGFDFPVLRERMKLRGVEHDWWRQMCIDQLQLHRKHFLNTTDGEQRQSFALDAVARTLLKRHKVPLRDRLRERGIDPGPAGILASWQHAPDLLEEYNRGDVSLQVAIEGKTQFLQLHLALCSLVNCLPRGDSLTPTRIMDALMMRLGAEHGHHWPTRLPYNANPWVGQAKASGAAVMLVEPGLSEGVSVLDVASLYPSLIRALNLGPDTKRDDGPIAPIRTDMKGHAQNQVVARFAGHDQPGQLPRALERILGKRREFDAKIKLHPAGSREHDDLKRLSNACKVAANSMYGIVLQPGSRYYDPQVGESVTNAGRLCIRAVVDEIERRGHRVILQDTDSAAFACGPEAAPAIVDAINLDVFPAVMAKMGVPPLITQRVLAIKFEERYTRLLQVATKKYAGIFEVYKGVPAQGEVFDAKGLEYVRGDTVQAARRLQREVVERALRGEAPAALRFLCEGRRALFMEHPIDPHDVMIHQSLTKSPDAYKSQGPHVIAALRMRERGLVHEGEKVAYWFSAGAMVELAEDWDPARVDRAYYWDDKIWPPTERVLCAAFPDHDWRLGARGTQGTLPNAPAGRKRRAVVASPEARVRIELSRDPADELGDRRTIAQVVELARAHPGPRPLVVELHLSGSPIAHVIETSFKVSAGCQPALTNAAQRRETPATLDLFVKI